MTAQRRELPLRFIKQIRALEVSYLESDDPIVRSGFGGGAERWRKERGPLMDAIESDGDLLDIGCANGYLLERLVTSGRDRGVVLTSHGLDSGARLVELDSRSRIINGRPEPQS